MDILWFGETCFRLISNQATILTDPFDVELPGAAATADIVTLSWRPARDRLVAGPTRQLIDGPGEYEVKGVAITGVATEVDPPEGGSLPAGKSIKNFIYSLTLDGVSLTHLGRLNRMPSALESQQLGTPDVLIVPLGAPFGLGVQPAVALASQLEAKLLIPAISRGGDRAALERFCRELGADPSNLEPRLSVTSSGLPAQTRVAVLAVQGRQEGG